MADAARLLGASPSDDAPEPSGAARSHPDPAVDAALEAARALVADDRVRDAIGLLTEANRRARHPLIERTLVTLRHTGFEQAAHPDAPPQPRDDGVHLETRDGVPWVAPSELSVDAFEQGLRQFGCLLVPGLLGPAQVERLVDGVDHAFAAFDEWQAAPEAKRDDEAHAWFTPFEPAPRYGEHLLGGRLFTRKSGAVWTVESPRMLFEVIETFEQVGLGSLIASHLGERPALSAAKCNLRRTPTHIPGAWHQDGSFLGADIASVDVWVALSACGRDAAGLDLVPHRFDHLLDTGLDSVVVAHETVLDAVEPLDVEIVSPEFGPGDVMLFDHLFLHRTATSPEMSRDRHALETWFFSTSNYPDQQIPLLY